MKNIPLVFLTLFLFSCQSASEKMDFAQGENAASAMRMSDQDDVAPEKPESLETEKRKIIQTVDLRMKVENLKKSTEKIQSLVLGKGGYIVQMNQIANSRNFENDLEIRIESEKLDEFIAEVEKEGLFINHKRISAQDVTMEYIDVQSRLETRKTVRDRFIDILRNKAKTVEDVLNAEEKIRNLQEEIEAAEARLKYLDNKSSMSTVLLNMYEAVRLAKIPGTYSETFGMKLKSSLEMVGN
ncbi:MAG: DUF4349 domain-containing protein [Saprospiraceae bacterium]